MWDTEGLSSSLRLMATQLKEEIIIIIVSRSHTLLPVLFTSSNGSEENRKKLGPGYMD